MEPTRGAKRRYSQILKLKSYRQDTCAICFSIKCFFLLIEAAEKGTQFVFQWNFIEKKLNFLWIFNFTFIWWAILLTNISYELHETYILGSTFFMAPRRSKNTKIIFFSHFFQGRKPTFWCLLRLWSSFLKMFYLHHDMENITNSMHRCPCKDIWTFLLWDQVGIY